VPLVPAKCRKLCPILTVALLLLHGCGGDDDGVLEEVSEKVYPVEPDANISIHNQDGAILVYGGEANEIRVRSLKRAYSQERLNQIAIDVSTQPGAVSVTAKVPPRPKWAVRDYSGTVDCTIVVPATASISELDLNAGEVLLDSMRGREVHARLNDGRILARNCFTNLNLTMKRGTLTLTYDWWVEPKFSAQANVGLGNAWVFLPSNAGLHLLARTTRGKIANDFNDVPLIANSSGSEMKIDEMVNGGGPATINIRVDRGNIKIAEANP
jgi:hypothetical protein